MADRIVLTKTDLVADAAALVARLRALNPAAPILDAAGGEATAARLLGGPSYDPGARGADVTGWLAAEAVEDAHHGHHHHDVNRHDARIRASVLRWPRPVSPHVVTLFTELLCSAYGAGVLRMKGLVALDDDPSRPAVLHGVQHVLHPPYRLDAWPDADHTTRLVFILKDLAPDLVEGLWRAAVGAPGIDRSDLAANPLAPTPGGLLANG